MDVMRHSWRFNFAPCVAALGDEVFFVFEDVL
jgi:hypothetical protein